MILSRQAAIPLVRSLLAVPATSTIRGIPSELMLDEDDGMPRECVLSFDNIESVDKRRFIEAITTLRGERLAEVCRTLTRTTGC
jgi:mRNA interferase MazF